MYFNPRRTRLPSLVDAIPFTPLSDNSAVSIGLPMDHDANYFFSFLEDYEKYVFPVNPIITVLEARQAIEEMPHSREACAFIYALVAVTTILTRNIGDVDRSTRASVTYWTDQIILTKPPIISSTEITARMIMTCDFLSISLMGLQKADTAFYYLREATTLVAMMRIDDPMTLARLPAHERARRQRLYWEMFVHERYYTISCYQNSVLRPLSNLPEQDLETPYHVQQGFTQIVRLFKIIDEAFIANWLESRSDGTASPSRLALQAWIESKHREINEEPAGSDEMVSQLTVMQQADLVLTKHWLRTLVWQLALSKCLLGSSNSSISLTFPLGMSGSLRTLVNRIARRDIEVHGAGILVKFFEITDTIASVILSQPIASMPELVQHIEDFVLLAKFLFSLPTFGVLQRQILNDKLSTLRRRFSAASSANGGAGTGAGAGAATAFLDVGAGDGMQGFSEWLDQTSFDAAVADATAGGQQQVMFFANPN